jgi:hypothetical protein
VRQGGRDRKREKINKRPKGSDRELYVWGRRKGKRKKREAKRKEKKKKRGSKVDRQRKEAGKWMGDQLYADSNYVRRLININHLFLSLLSGPKPSN